MEKLNKLLKFLQHSDIGSALLKEFLYIFLGVLLFAIFIKEQGPLRFISGAGFLFALYHLILIIRSAPEIVNELFPPKYSSEKRAPPFHRFIYYAATTFFFLSMLFLVTETKRIDNTFNGMKLFWIGSFIGIMLAILLTVMIKKINPSVYYDGKRRFVIHFGLFLGFFLFGSASANFINHAFSDKGESWHEYRIAHKSINSRTRSHYLFINVGNGDERFEVGRSLFDKVNEGGDVMLCIKSGRLGFPFVTKFEPVQQ
jgi:hypothetical protein